MGLMKPKKSFGQQQVLDLVKMIRPWTMASTAKVRIGNENDGGYVTPASALECDVVVSIGIGTDVSFDLALAERGARILQFDHTVDGPPHQHPNFVFTKLGWGPKTEGSFIGFDKIHSQLTKLNPLHSMLKFDIEGEEFDVLETTRVEHLKAFDVIVCEVHYLERLGDPIFFAKVESCFAKLTANHVPVHLHANNYQALILVEGVPIPRVLELSFLRKDLDHFRTLSSDPIPGPLDRPNHRGVPDLCLNPF
jgi:hypothetical protein